MLVGQKDIWRWLAKEDDTTEDAITLTIPKGVVAVSALSYNDDGQLAVLKVTPPDEADPIEFPEIHIWQDPTNNPHWFSRIGEEVDWEKEEDTLDLLMRWENEVLVPIKDQLFRMFHTLQVVYRKPPTIEAVRFHRDGTYYAGWRVEMIGAFFGGFRPEGLDEFSWAAQKPRLVIPESPRLV